MYGSLTARFYCTRAYPPTRSCFACTLHTWNLVGFCTFLRKATVIRLFLGVVSRGHELRLLVGPDCVLEGEQHMQYTRRVSTYSECLPPVAGKPRLYNIAFSARASIAHTHE
ncbi:unnamed protein product, partial [Scytosiphon promiscuus]